MVPDVISVEVVDESPRPWGLWPTLGFSLAVGATFSAIQVVVVVIWVAAAVGNAAVPSPQFVESLGTNGLLLSLTNWITLPFTLGLIALFVRLRGSWSLQEYLALYRVPAKTLLVWLGLVAMLVAAYEGITWLCGHPSSEFMIQIYQTAGFAPLLWATLLVQAPVFEEVFFRGFMFRGIEQSRLGGIGAIVITSLAWTLMHAQYDAFILTWVFALGMVMGIARWKSGCVCLAMAMHAFANLIALIGVNVWFVQNS
jgi:uncharacterized protein